MSESIQTSLIVLLNPEIVRVVVGISLLSYIQAEIYVTAYLLCTVANQHRVKSHKNYTELIITNEIYILNRYYTNRHHDSQVK